MFRSFSFYDLSTIVYTKEELKDQFYHFHGSNFVDGVLFTMEVLDGAAYRSLKLPVSVSFLYLSGLIKHVHSVSVMTVMDKELNCL